VGWGEKKKIFFPMQGGVLKPATTKQDPADGKEPLSRKNKGEDHLDGFMEATFSKS